MVHSFDPLIAAKFGVNPAILLYNINYWIEKNKANKKHFYDGNYWTYNSMEAFSSLFPYMTTRQVDYALKKLLDEGIIIKGNYNKSSYDRTLWYAITEKGYSILQNPEIEETELSNANNNNVVSISQNCEMETTKLLNGNDKIVEPIPNINTNINTDNNLSKKDAEEQLPTEVGFQDEKKSDDTPSKNDEEFQPVTFDEIIEKYSDNENVQKLLKEWLKIRKVKRMTLTNGIIYENLKKIDKLSKDSNMSIEEYLQEAISKGWGNFYKIEKTNNKTKESSRKELVPDWIDNQQKEFTPADPKEVARIKAMIESL